MMRRKKRKAKLGKMLLFTEKKMFHPLVVKLENYGGSGRPNFSFHSKKIDVLGHKNHIFLINKTLWQQIH